jgi:hypothetical protein
MSTVTMQELELETAELLPARETLCVPKCYSHGNSSNVSFSQSANGGSFNGSGDGNGDGGLLGGIGNGTLDGNFSGNAVNIAL